MNLLDGFRKERWVTVARIPKQDFSTGEWDAVLLRHPEKKIDDKVAGPTGLCVTLHHDEPGFLRVALSSRSKNTREFREATQTLRFNLGSPDAVGKDEPDYITHSSDRGVTRKIAGAIKRGIR